MVAVLGHRGPDGEGIYVDPEEPRCGLGHRRLAIIDIEGGRQPMGNEDGTVWIVYNGECYNFRQLRELLEGKGHVFRTACDTEVIVHLYEEYGQECVNHLRGMFAFAVWDRKRRALFLARDRLGKKPLYYAVHNGRFLFASECKAILQSEDFPRRADRGAIGEYLLLQYVPAPRTAYADIRQLPPGHSLLVTGENYQQPCSRSYWSLPVQPGFEGTFPQACEQLRQELTRAVEMRMISDVPLGAFLSGGIDSTIIVGLMSQLQKEPVTTCTIGFDNDLYDETPYARQTARHFGTTHHEQTVHADCLEAIEKLSYYYDEPFADSSALPTWYLSRLAREQVTVVLSGDGGDECFGGYDRYRGLQLAEKLNRNLLLGWLLKRRFWQNLSSREHRSFSKRLKRFASGMNLPVDRRYLQWMAVFDPDLLQEILTGSAVIPVWDRFAGYFPETTAFGSEAGRHAGQAMVCDGQMYLPGDLNTKTDRASMSVGLELRCPFQDHKVMELAYSLPIDWRIRGRVGKYILRKACSDLLPPAIQNRPKRGFGVPVGSWFRDELRDLFCDTVLSPRAMARGYFHKTSLEKLLRENDNKQEDHGHRLWALLMLELWFRKYIEK